MNPSRRLALPVLCVVALALAGCGGGGDDDTPRTVAGKDGKPPIGASEGFAKKSSLVKGDSSAGDGGEDYVPEGELIADSGFRPTADGFSFENYGNDVGPENLTAEEVQNLFGDTVCLSGSGETGDCRLTPAAQTWMENQNEGMSGGHCQGFSVSALRFFNENLDPTDFGADTVPDLPIVDNVELQEQIAEAFTYQFLPPIVERRVKGTPSQVLERLGEALQSGDELYTLGIYKPDLTGGHAITPFAIEDKGDGQAAILVYDNNFPGVTRAVEVDTNEDTWRYVGGTNPDNVGEVYEGDAETQTLELDPTLPVEEEYSPCPFCDGEDASEDGKSSLLPKDERFTEITLNGDPRNHPHLVFEDERGRRTGIVNGKLLREIPDVEVVRALGVRNWEVAPEPRFRLPEGAEYEITVDGSKLSKPTKASINLVGNGLVVDVEEISMEPGQKDGMALPGGYGITYGSTSKRAEAPNIFAALERDDKALNFAASAVGVKPGSAISLLVDQEEDVVILDSTGSEPETEGVDAQYIVQLTQADAKGRTAQWQRTLSLDGEAEEKVGFEYSDSPTRGKPLPLIKLDGDAEIIGTLSAKPS